MLYLCNFVSISVCLWVCQIFVVVICALKLPQKIPGNGNSMPLLSVTIFAYSSLCNFV